ncbi:unnamed protein product [Cylicocyclus nassatus]|uniref:Uncharacterized protein n=1 Tax=Cylicocyclus nassatus TaxID=53992 RepID=A0AA36MET1_CYLNA|nr:unnamed protein product [Cylicocyclus nassatus]
MLSGQVPYMPALPLPLCRRIPVLSWSPGRCADLLGEHISPGKTENPQKDDNEEVELEKPAASVSQRWRGADPHASLTACTLSLTEFENHHFSTNRP